MIDNITQSKLILMAYGELNDEHNLEMQALIASNEIVRKEWFDIKNSIDQIENKYLKPSENSIKKILNHNMDSKKLNTI